MFKNVPVIALIPARAGSKGLPGKNIRPILGIPLIEYTINAALGSTLVDYVVVSSNDEVVLSIAKNKSILGILRPNKYASDEASAVEVVNHFINIYSREIIEKDPYILYLQPTSPLRTALHIDKSFETLYESGADSLVSVTEIKQTPFKSFTVDAEGYLRSIFDEKMSNARRQDLPTTFIPNGAIYIFRVSSFKERLGFPSNGSVAFFMSHRDSLDIDTEEDFSRAELILEAGNG